MRIRAFGGVTILALGVAVWAYDYRWPVPKEDAERKNP